MFIDSKTFKEIVVEMTRLTQRCEMLEKRVETLEQRPIMVDTDSVKKKDVFALFEEMTNARPDESGKLRYTDGRD